MDDYTCSKLILDTLKRKGLLDKTALVFNLKTSNSQKIQFTENLLKEHNLMPNFNELKLKKCNKKAEEFKNLGNQVYKDEKFAHALVNYNKSLCYSPEDSQNVGIGFANRSAVYFSMGQYEKCLENIKLAKNHNYPKEKIDKLNKREVQAIEKLNNCPEPNQKLIQYEAARERFLKPKLKAKENLNFFVADCLELKTSPEFGRHLITNEDLKVGSVIAVEKPFVKIVEPGAIYETCSNCLGRNLLNLLPCSKCCSAMFCSEDCRSAAQEKFHKFECGLVNVINQLFSKPSCMALKTYFEALHVCETPGKLREFLNSIKDSKATILDFKYTDEASFRKNSLHSIDALVTVEKSQYCTSAHLFQLSVFSAIVCNLLFNHSESLKSLLMDDADQDYFRELIFKYMQTSNTNAHSFYCMTPTNESDDCQIGSGFYPFCSLMNHSCASNIVRESFDTSNYIIVCRPIKKGEQVFDNYGYHHYQKPLETRQKELFQQYFFKCQCEGCLKNYPMRDDLKIKDENLMAAYMMNDDVTNLLEERTLDMAVKNFERYCKFIDIFDNKYYPSCEISNLQDFMVVCIRSFMKNETYGKAFN